MSRHTVLSSPAQLLDGHFRAAHELEPPASWAAVDCGGGLRRVAVLGGEGAPLLLDQWLVVHHQPVGFEPGISDADAELGADGTVGPIGADEPPRPEPGRTVTRPRSASKRTASLIVDFASPDSSRSDSRVPTNVPGARWRYAPPLHRDLFRLSLAPSGSMASSERSAGIPGWLVHWPPFENRLR
jgi:hypothetical protein